ncbi:hypothetical protein MY3296_000402 [Beauveria thailandica]
MFRSFVSFFGGRNSDPPPEYHTVDPLNRQDGQESPPTERGGAPLFEPDFESPIEQDDTPRNRFDYYVDLRRFQQLVEWQIRNISPDLYGDFDSRVEVARDWVIDCWKRHGIWAASWRGTGPSHNDKWPCRDSGGMPTSLLSLELEWEMEHLVELHRPTRIPELFGSQYLPPSRDVPLQWGFDHLVRTALYNVNQRWRRAGFRCSGVDQPGVRFCRDLKLLYASLPIPAREKLDSLDACCWADLFRGETRQNQAPRTDMFGRLIGDAQPNASQIADGWELEPPETDIWGRINGDAQANSMPSPTTDGSVLQAPRTTIFGRVIRDAQANAMSSLSAEGSVLEQPRTGIFGRSNEGIFGRSNEDVQVATMLRPTADGLELEQPQTGIFGRSNGDAQVTAILSPTADGLELEQPRTGIFGRLNGDAQANAMPSPTADGSVLEQPRTGIFGRSNGDAQVTTILSPTADGLELEPTRTDISGRITRDAQANATPSPTADGLELEPTRIDISGRITRDAQANATPSPTADGLELEEISQVVQTRRTTRGGGRVPRRPPRRRGVVKRRRGVAERRRRGL